MSAESIAASGTPATNNNREKSSTTPYKRVQVRCKQALLEDIPNLPGLLDFGQPDIVKTDNDRVVRLKNPKGDGFYQGPLFGVTQYPGFVMAPQALSQSLQAELAFQAVTEYCETPHATNIDLVQPKPSEQINTAQETMSQLWKSSSSQGKKDPTTPQKATTQSTTQKNGPTYYRSFRKLSWATTGYHYDWTARSYHEGLKSPMPDLLQTLSRFFAGTSLAMSTATESKNDTNTTEIPPFTPSASIVNYYNAKSVMGGHRDDLEYALDKPVISISLGLQAIFLLGGKTKEDVTVLPIVTRPGDVMILGGDARLNYHGMARVLPADVTIPNSVNHNTCEEPTVGPTADQMVTRDMLNRLYPPDAREGMNHDGDSRVISTNREAEPDEEDQVALEEFLRQHRININVRQVYPDEVVDNTN